MKPVNVETTQLRRPFTSPWDTTSFFPLFHLSFYRAEQKLGVTYCQTKPQIDREERKKVSRDRRTKLATTSGIQSWDFVKGVCTRKPGYVSETTKPLRLFPFFVQTRVCLPWQYMILHGEQKLGFIAIRSVSVEDIWRFLVASSR